jgi:bis(5'-nucleosidyl)-tetraphosphatase
MIKKEFSFGVIPLQKTEEGISVLLTLHKGGKHWGFPKGHQDPGETNLETAKRELKEETGLEIETLLLDVPFEESYTFYKFHEKVRKTVCYYPAFVKGTLKLQEEEIIDAKWHPVDEASKYMTFKEAREILEKALKLI